MTSAADLKFLHRVQLACTRNFKSKSGTRIIELLVPFCLCHLHSHDAGTIVVGADRE
jgi:hypothetical protein